MSPSPVPSIPFDILDLILDFVDHVPNTEPFQRLDRDATSSLTAWRSTCRYFNVMVRPRLWRVIMWNDKDDSCRIRFEALFYHFQTSPEIAGFVQSFIFRASRSKSSARFDNPELIKIFSKLTNLRGFKFECSSGLVHWKQDIHANLQVAFEDLCQIPSLTIIEMRGITLVPPNIILSCKNLSRLVLRDFSFVSSVATPGQPSTPAPKIKKLELWPTIASSNMLMLDSLQMFSRVEDLSLSIFDKDDLDIALAILSSAKMTVRRLKIGGTHLFGRSHQGSKHQLDLEELVNLEHIQAYFIMDTDTYASKCLPRNLVDLLDRSQPSLTVQTLHIYLKIYVVGTELMLHLTDGWEEFDDIVTTKYPGLHLLRLEFISLFAAAPEEDEELVKIHIRSMLPKTTATDRIKVQVITDTGLVWDL